MCTAEQYGATATEYKERADRATAPDEKRQFQDLERTFRTLADNEQWLSTGARTQSEAVSCESGLARRG
jgi:hypothetical protein